MMTVSQIRIVQDPKIPASLVRDVQAKLAYLDEVIKTARVSIDGLEIELVFHRAIDDARQAKIRMNVDALVESMCHRAFDPQLPVVDDHTKPVAYQQDPMPILLARREVVQEGPGYFVIGPMMSRLVNYVESRLVQVADHLEAAPYRFPALISPAYLEKVEYFKNFPHSLSFVTHLREDLENIQRFSRMAVTHEDVVAIDGQSYAPFQAMLAPTVCHHLYFSLADSEIGPNGLTATANGHCFRYESINMVSLERLWNFTMREIIFVGTAEQTKRRLDEARTHVGGILKDLSLSYRIMTANDPFFIDTFRKQTQIQQTFEMKFEIQADLPYKQDTIAVGSYNRHGNFFGRSLNIRLTNGSPAFTACFAMGFERLAFAFVSQHGLDIDQWPAAVRDAVLPLSPER
jgi:seryl-tRNA synthetase